MVFNFNLATKSDVLRDWRLHDSSTFNQDRELRGQISVLRGNASQLSDVEVRIISHSTDAQELQNLIFKTSDTTFNVAYIPSRSGRSCTEMNIQVYLRLDLGHPVDHFEIKSSHLDIWFYHKLNWEINNLVTHTTHGDHTFEANGWQDELIVHNMHTSVGSGELFGYYVAHGNITLESDSGGIGIFNMPNYGGYHRPESLTVSSNSGDIGIQASVEYWTAFNLTHTTNIHSVSGNIDAQTVHGVYTNISTGTGDVLAVILPFGLPTPETVSEVYTDSRSGDVDFWIRETWQESLDGSYDPMLNTISEHDVEVGRMTLRYPYSWYGSMEGKIDRGELKFDSSTLEELERGERYVKAKRGTHGKSQAEAWVGAGELDIRLGL